MIKMPHPAMAVNAEQLDTVRRFKMWNTRLVTKDITPYWLATNIASVAAGAPGGKLAALIFNCHGLVNENGDFLELGLGTGVSQKDLKHFSKLRGLVDKIYIKACGAAKGKRGKSFCGELARKVNTYVYAADSDQRCPTSIAIKMEAGEIDNFEGTVFRFGPAGEAQPVTNLQ